MAPALYTTLLFLLSGGPAAAKKNEPHESWLPKGNVVWGVGANVGFSNGTHARHLESAAIRLGRVVSGPRGPGWLEGRLGFEVELVPLFLLRRNSTTYGAGFNMVGRHYIERGSRLRPFLSLGVGMLLSAKEIPEETTRLNFTPQIGLGFLFKGDGRRVYSLEGRLHHISNGGRAETNPGVNSVVVQFGVLFPRSGEAPAVSK